MYKASSTALLVGGVVLVIFGFSALPLIYGLTGCCGDAKSPGYSSRLAPDTSARNEYASFVGPQGRVGPSGPAGARGAVGYTGSRGATVVGIQGPVGPAGQLGAFGDNRLVADRRLAVLLCTNN